MKKFIYIIIVIFIVSFVFPAHADEAVCDKLGGMVIKWRSDFEIKREELSTKDLRFEVAMGGFLFSLLEEHCSVHEINMLQAKLKKLNLWDN